MLHFHDRTVRGIPAGLIQADEVWSFVRRNDRKRGAEPGGPDDGSVWTFTALDTRTRLILSWLMGGRDFLTARAFAHDLRGRVVGTPRISTDGLASYLGAIEDVFGSTALFGQEVYGERIVIEGDPADAGWINTSLQERLYFSLRQQNRRFTRKTSGYSKLLEMHAHAFALWVVAYNFTKQHTSLQGVTPAMEAGLVPDLRDVDWLARLVEESYDAPGRRGPYRPKLRLRS